MKICIPTESNRGLESEVCPHFGKAPCHLVLDSESAELLATNEQSCFHEEGGEHQCAPIDWMISQRVEVVICHSLGKGALNRLQNNGIRVLKTKAGSVIKLMEGYKKGTCEPFEPSHTCSGHDH